MKKSTMRSLVAYLNGEDVTNIDEIKQELEVELNRNAEKARANQELYAAARDTVINALSDIPVTVAELYESCKDELPEGFTKSKVQYALNNYWADAAKKIIAPHDVNRYTRA